MAAPIAMPHNSQRCDDMQTANISKSQVAVVYGRIAWFYDFWAWLTESRARDRCLQLAAIRDGENVLEVAVGTGLAFARILRANPSGRCEGIDLTPAMLDRARKRARATGHENFRLRIGDAYALDYQDGKFDVLVNNYLFDLLPEDDFPVVLEEFKRVLRPGGRLVLVNMAAGRRWYERIWEHIYRLHPALLGGCRPVSLVPCLQRSGFRDIACESVSQFTFTSEVIRATGP